MDEIQKPKVVEFKLPDSELAKQAEVLKRELPYVLELACLQARIQVQRYNEYLKLGMSPEQALYLIK